jgi:hypothetical protein
MGSKLGKTIRKDKNKLKGKNLLDFVPVRTCEWAKQDKNKELVRILKPRFDTKFGEKLGKKMKLKETYNINLDEYGTAVWRLIDGKLTVRDIGEMLETQFGQSVQPLYPRLAAFLRILESNNTIELKPKRIRKKLKKV